MKTKIAVVTGANRGMGLAVSQKLASLDYHVIMVARNKQDSKIENAEWFIADIANEKQTNELINYISEKYGYVNVLINNAGIFIDESKESAEFNYNEKVFRDTLDINTIGPYRLMKGLRPLMVKNNYGRVVNVSSGLGSFEGAAAYCLAYSVSKSALNMLTNLFASQVQGTNVKVNAICPGWVKTDMGGASAPRTIEQGIAGMVWAATLDESGPNGGFFRDGQPINW